MVRIIVSKIVDQENSGPKFYIEASGDSTDTKPSDSSIAQGSLFYESDTGNFYIFSESSQSWVKQCSLQE